ncbi:dihydrolipoyllysine-residue succinyltransferase component of 2-oxoglutarate dehydrogenase complex, mitochondrial-like isoform X2 [Littorina saxatilis]|uniref:dihydrolipoyllysine-residue succinyltransferase component of 2-oxoglutarate dehydrogenase complex, mitochondrial-like isoform X2 n=1 Tax=Littorina saxatilis TaxID=31220 RepID=UPI0038B53521
MRRSMSCLSAMLASSVRYLPRCARRFSAWRPQLAKTKVSANAEAEISSGSACWLLGCRHGSKLSRFHGGSVVAGFQPSSSFHSSTALYDEVKTVVTPGFPESVAEGDVRWEKAVGDFVGEDESVGEIETDKTSLALLAPASGIIEELLVPDGGKVVAGQEIYKLKLSGDAPAKKAEPAAEKPAAAEAAAPAPPPPSQPSSTAGPPPSSPPPVPPKPSAPMASVPTSSVKPTPAKAGAAPVHLTGSRTEQRVKMNRMRQRIAQRLKDAQNSCAMLTTFNEIDMSNIMEMRNKYKDTFNKKFNLKLGFMSAFVKASAYALTDQPVVNAVIDEQEIVYRDYVDISVAVATPKGLVVPVIRNVEGMNYADIEMAINEMGEKARAGNLAIEDMDGGTFTISNGGVFGSMFGTPIINPPQSAILGMHAIFDRPVAIGGKVEIKPMMYVALTYDHKLVDGREAVTFLRKIKSAVEDPRVLLLDL